MCISGPCSIIKVKDGPSGKFGKSEDQKGNYKIRCGCTASKESHWPQREFMAWVSMPSTLPPSPDWPASAAHPKLCFSHFCANCSHVWLRCRRTKYCVLFNQIIRGDPFKSIRSPLTECFCKVLPESKDRTFHRWRDIWTRSWEIKAIKFPPVYQKFKSQF